MCPTSGLKYQKCYSACLWTSAGTSGMGKDSEWLFTIFGVTTNLINMVLTGSNRETSKRKKKKRSGWGGGGEASSYFCHDGDWTALLLWKWMWHVVSHDLLLLLFVPCWLLFPLLSGFWSGGLFSPWNSLHLLRCFNSFFFSFFFSVLNHFAPDIVFS